MMFRKQKIAPPPPDLSDAPLASPRLAPRSPSEAIKPMVAPSPPAKGGKARGGMLSTLSGFLTLFVVLAISAVLAAVFLEREATTPGPLPADKVVLIPKSTGVGEIAALLKREGVISQTLLFELYSYLNRQRGPLKAGEFLFRARTSIDEAIDTLIQGKAILHSFTVPEGLTSEQIVQRLVDNEILTGDVTDRPREGTLLPDTYKFERGETRQQVVNRMQRAHREALSQIWARRAPDLPIKTPQELVILASIVEKETGRADERSRVAGVFINRLAKRMKLQSDPTIVYGLVGGQGTLGRGILRSEIEKATPYNTYAIEGLPPTPIANPGRAALEAVANPSRTKDLYFVADGSGGHVFAETYDQHLKNVARWRQVEKARTTEPQGSVDRIDPALSDAADSVPTAASAFTQGQMPGQPARPAGGKPQTRNGRWVDASEGTARDPLLNKSYDLNTPKSVPPLKQQP